VSYFYRIHITNPQPSISFSIKSKVPQHININHALHTQRFDSQANIVSPFNNDTIIFENLQHINTTNKPCL
jgi:hypothetical protein